jgi:hypothetical protein
VSSCMYINDMLWKARDKCIWNERHKCHHACISINKCLPQIILPILYKPTLSKTTPLTHFIFTFFPSTHSSVFFFFPFSFKNPYFILTFNNLFFCILCVYSPLSLTRAHTYQFFSPQFVFISHCNIILLTIFFFCSWGWSKKKKKNWIWSYYYLVWFSFLA